MTSSSSDCRDGDDLFARFGARAQKDVERRIAAIVEDHVSAFGEHEGFVQVVPMLGQRLPFDGEDRDARRAMAAAAWSWVEKMLHEAQRTSAPSELQRFDQHGGLDRHVQRADDARALQGLRRAEFLAAGHQARHFGFRDGEFLAAEFGQRDVAGNREHCLANFSRSLGAHFSDFTV
jgi:hypothetical protein